MGFSDLYYKLEEKYYSSLDWFDSKGLHFLYNFDEWLQSKNLPSFIIMTLLTVIVLAVIVLLILYFTGVFGPNTVNVTMNFVDVTNNATVPNLSVTLSYGENLVTKTTDADGVLSVVLPKDQEVDISISSDSYSLSQTAYTFSESGTETINLTSQINLLGSKTLHLYADEDKTALFTDLVQLNLSCSDNPDYLKKVTVVNGEVDLNDLPDDCGSLSIDSTNPELSKTIDVGVDSLDVVVEPEAQKTGTLRVIAQGSDGNVLSNITVSVFNQEDVLMGSQITPETGLVEFDLPIGQYYVNASDSGSGDYSYFSTKDMDIEGCNDMLSESQPTNCTIKLQKSNVGKINLLILDVADKPVNSANITIYKGDLQLYNETLQADAEGKFIRGVPEAGPYRVVIDSPQYMIYDNPNVMISDTPQEIHLEPVKSSPVLSVVVTANGESVANATVQLYKEGNLILTKTTGADGIAYFDRLEAGKAYSAKVTKGDYTTTSQPITLNPRIDNKLYVKMVIGKGNVDVFVLDKDGNPLDGSVELYNVFTNKLVSNATPTSQGVAHFYNISADKSVYAKVVAKGTSYSLPVDILADQTVTITAFNSKDSTTFNMSLLGVYNNDGSPILKSPYNVVPNSEYSALFLLKVPKGVAFTSGDIFFIGDPTAKSIAESSILIKNVTVLGGVETKGLTYTPKLGYANDMLNKTTDDALWSDVLLSKVNAGETLVKVDFVVSGNSQKDLFKMGYRASLKKGSALIRFPSDSELGQNESTSEKLGFYADTSYLNFKSGNLVCSDSACIELTASDSTGYKSKITDTLYAQYNTNTNLSFNIAPASKLSYQNLTLKIEQKNTGVDISNVTAILNHSSLSFNKKSRAYTAIVNKFDQTTNLQGSVDFTTSKAGDTVLTISLLSGDKTIFSRDVEIKVNSPNNLKIQYIPQLIVPYIINYGAVVITDANDGTPVVNATVNSYLNNKLIGSGKTDSDGKFALQITKPNAGDILKLEASAPGYNKNTSTIKITDNILVPDKPEINVTLDKSENEYANTNVVLTTTLPYKLKVDKVRFSSGEFLKFVNLTTNVKRNTIIDKNFDLNLNASFTDLGASLLEPKDFKTNLELIVTSDKIGKTWDVKIPLNIYVKMFDSLDVPDCLAINISNNVNPNEFTFNIKNNCTSQQEPADLYYGKISVQWDGTTLGKFFMKNRSVSDTNNFVFTKLKGSDSSSNSFTLKFVKNPNVASGKSTANIILTAEFPTNNGLQKVNASKKLSIVVSDYKKCLQVISPSGQILTAENVMMHPIVLGVATLNANMFGMLGGMYGGFGPYGMGSLSLNGLSSNASPMGYSMGGPVGTPATSAYQKILNAAGASNYPGLVSSIMGNNSGFVPGLGTTATNPGATVPGTSITPAGTSSTSQYSNILGINTREMPEVLNSNSGILNFDSSLDSVYNNSNNTILFDIYPMTASPLLQQQVLAQQYGSSGLYGMGMYGAMLPGMSLPPVSKLNFRNTCPNTINLRVMSMPQLMVSPQTVTIPTGKTSNVTIMSTMLPGTYMVNVLAGTKNNLNPLMTIPVRVIDYASNTANQDCFKLSEEPTIDMSSTFKRNKIITVYNYCYSKGVIFNEKQPVELHNLLTRDDVSVAIKNKQDCLDRINSYKKQDCSKLKGSEKTTCEDNKKLTTKSCDNITLDKKTPYVMATPIGTPEVKSSVAYGQYQSLDVMLEKDPSVQKIIVNHFNSGTALSDFASQLSALRSGLTDLYNNVVFPALFVINAQIGYGSAGIKKTIVKQVNVRDLWNVAGAAGLLEGFEGGSKSCVPGKAGKGQTSWDDESSRSRSNNETYILESTDFVNGEARVPYETSFALLKKPCFGSSDSVEFKHGSKDVVFKNKEGKKVTLTIMPHFDSGNIYFTVVPKSDLPVGDYKYSEDKGIPIEYTIVSYYHNDATYNDKHKTYRLKLKLDVTKGIKKTGVASGNVNTGTNVETKETKQCKDLFGKDWNSLSDYGFGEYNDSKLGNMLSFVYSDKYNDKSSINCTNNFCDAEQLKLFLSSKYKGSAVFNELNFKSYFKSTKQYLVDKDKNLKTLAVKDALDPLSLYFLKRDLKDAINDAGKPKTKNYSNFQSLVKNLPDLFLVTNSPCPKDLGKYVINSHGKCYYDANKIPEKIITSNLNKDFNVVMLISEDQNVLAQKLEKYKNNGVASIVYLKPDDYNAVFATKNFLGYVADVSGVLKVNKPGIYIAYTYEEKSKKKLILIKANNYYLDNAKDTLGDFFYKLSVDPGTRPIDYNGEFGLCVKKGTVTIGTGIAKTINIESCDKAKYNVVNVKSSDKNYLIFNNIATTSKGLVTFDLLMPNCNSTKCSIGVKDKSIVAPKDSYNLATIFKSSENYCYKGDNNIEIKYSGGAS